jgi:hypothetical protein
MRLTVVQVGGSPGLMRLHFFKMKLKLRKRQLDGKDLRFTEWQPLAAMSFALEQHSDVTCDEHDHQSINFYVCCRKRGPGLVDEHRVSISRQQTDWRPRSGPGSGLVNSCRSNAITAGNCVSVELNEFCFVQKWPTRVERGIRRKLRNWLDGASHFGGHGQYMRHCFV